MFCGTLAFVQSNISRRGKEFGLCDKLLPGKIKYKVSVVVEYFRPIN